MKSENFSCLGISRNLSAAIAVLSLASCSVRLPTHMSQTEIKARPPLFEWHGEGMTGPTLVKINLDEQKAHIYRGEQEAGWTILASGTEAHPTPSGNFYVMEKIEKKVSNLYGVIVNGAGNVVNWDAKSGVTAVPNGCRFVGAEMPYWMRLTSGGVGMHAGDIPEPGLPASHGCIRLPRDFAPTLFSVVNPGTRVLITGTGQAAVARFYSREKEELPIAQSRVKTATPSTPTFATLR